MESAIAAGGTEMMDPSEGKRSDFGRTWVVIEPDDGTIYYIK